jgi:inorganic triphosphatase YgiF
MSTEVEAKFLAADAAPLEALAAAETLGEATLGPAASVDETDIYLDTADGRLGTARWACRLRDRGRGYRVSLKGPADGELGPSWLHRRPEIEGEATSSFDPTDWPPGEARDLVVKLALGATLAERFRLVQRRIERPVWLDDSELGTLSLDVAAVEHEGVERGRLHIVELELSMAEDPRSDTRLGQMAISLAAVPGLTADHRTKMEHAIGLLAAG